MRFIDLNCFVDLGCFKQTSFYSQRLEEIVLADINDALDRIQLIDGPSARYDAFNRLQISVEQAAQNGWVSSAAKLLPDPLSNISETGYMLSRFERGERAAILFALTENLSLLETITMKRCDLRDRELSPEAAEIVDRLTPHLRCEWLFWRINEGTAVPLSNLPGRWRQKMPMSWEHFRQTYRQRGDKGHLIKLA